MYSYFDEHIQSIHDHIDQLFLEQKNMEKKDHNNNNADSIVNVVEDKINDGIVKKEQILNDENEENKNRKI